MPEEALPQETRGAVSYTIASPNGKAVINVIIGHAFVVKKADGNTIGGSGGIRHSLSRFGGYNAAWAAAKALAKWG